MVNLHEAARCRKDGVYTPVYESGSESYFRLILKGLTWFMSIGDKGTVILVPLSAYTDNNIIELI